MEDGKSDEGEIDEDQMDQDKDALFGGDSEDTSDDDGFQHV